MRYQVEENSTEVEKDSSPNSNKSYFLFILGIGIIFAGLFLMFISFIFSGEESSISGAAIILIGPIPIVIGSGPNASWLILAGIILTIISLVTFIILRRRVRY